MSSVWYSSKKQVGDQSASLCIHHNTNSNLTKLYTSHCTHLSRFVSGMNLSRGNAFVANWMEKGASDVLSSKEFEPSSPSLMPLSNEFGSHWTAVASVTKVHAVHTETEICVNYSVTRWQRSTFKISRKNFAINRRRYLVICQGTHGNRKTSSLTNNAVFCSLVWVFGSNTSKY